MFQTISWVSSKEMKSTRVERIEAQQIITVAALIMVTGQKFVFGGSVDGMH